MKKSIFLFFAAILCAMSVSAKVIYFKPNGNWASSNAAFYANVWGGSGVTNPVKFTPVANDATVYEAEVGTNTSIIFLRMDPSKNVTSDNMWTSSNDGGPLWNRMGDLSIPAEKNCCTIKDGQWTQQVSNASSYVTWSTYTPPTEPVIPDYYVAGNSAFVGANSWDDGNAAHDALKMVYSETNANWTLTVSNVAADAACEFKVNDGTWSKSWGYDKLSTIPEGVSNNTDGNICFTLSTAGDVTVTFDGTNIQLTTTGAFKTFNTYDITVKAVVPEVWTSETISIHYWGDGVESPATPAPTVKEGNWNVYTITGIPEGKSVSVIFLNGTAWTSDKTQQTVNLTDITGNTCFQISAINKATDDENKCTATVVDCDADITPEPAVPVVTYDYYIAGTLPGAAWNPTSLGMTKEGELYKATFSELSSGIYEFKITAGDWEHQWNYNNLGAAYEEVSQGVDGEGNPNGNIKFGIEEAKNITVIFDATAGKITIDGLTEKAPAEPVTVYFINSGNWAEVACYYWGGIESSTWPGAPMTANGEVFEAEGWNVYKVTFPGDNTYCVFNDNKAEGATQTGDLEVQDGKYYCYANGIWYERLADVDPLDTRVYLKGEMNEWCDAGYCYMFRKETVDGTVAYSHVYLEEANTTYEFKIEDAGAWLSNTGTMTKDDCTDWTFEADKDNCKITTEYVGEYTFVWDMTTKKLSVVYPELVPTVMDLVVTNMTFDGATTFSGSDNEYGIVFNLVVGNPVEDQEGVFALDASSTVDFGGAPFTNVTGTIAPDMNTFASATAVVYGFLGGSEYFQFNIDMSAGGGTPVQIWDGVATPNDATSELTISATWEGDDVYVVVPGFNYTNYECPEVWFYVGGTTWETASIAAYGPAKITVEDGGVLVEGSVMSGVTGTSYTLMVFGLLPVEETPDYTRGELTAGKLGTLCLPFGGTITGAVLYECVGSETGKVYLGSVNTLTAGVPYIFQATATELAVYSDGTTAATAGNSNGLHGTFTDETPVAEGNYILLGNTLRPSNGEAKVNANRAYLVMSEVPAGAPQQMPGRRYIGMDVQGENEATGVEDLFTTDAPVKVIENGQLIIIRDGVKYNVQGQKL